jgi:peroxiredoxin
MSETTRLEKGQTAPDFTLPDQDGAPVTLSDLRGQDVIVYFYPAAGTPGCTTQACDFRDSTDSLQRAGYRVLGVSKDPQEDLARFREEQGLGFTLLSDPDLEVHRAVRGVRREVALRQEGHRRDPLHDRGRRRGPRRPPALQRQGHGPCGLAAEEARRRRLTPSARVLRAPGLSRVDASRGAPSA